MGCQPSQHWGRLSSVPQRSGGARVAPQRRWVHVPLWTVITVRSKPSCQSYLASVADNNREHMEIQTPSIGCYQGSCSCLPCFAVKLHFICDIENHFIVSLLPWAQFFLFLKPCMPLAFLLLAPSSHQWQINTFALTWCMPLGFQAGVVLANTVLAKCEPEEILENDEHVGPNWHQ